MNLDAAKYAVLEFDEMKAELTELIESMDLPALQCRVRQKADDASPDSGWVFFDVGIDDGGNAFWGKLHEVRDGRQAKVFIVMDVESIDSIEFEVYES